MDIMNYGLREKHEQLKKYVLYIITLEQVLDN
jgi:hypothetical protein